MSHLPKNKFNGIDESFSWNFKLHLKTSRKITFFNSKSHTLNVNYQCNSGNEIHLEMDKVNKPKKDFFFTFTTEEFHLPNYILSNNDASSTILLSFIPKFCQLSVDDAYNASIEGKKVETELSIAKG